MGLPSALGSNHGNIHVIPLNPLQAYRETLLCLSQEITALSFSPSGAHIGINMPQMRCYLLPLYTPFHLSESLLPPVHVPCLVNGITCGPSWRPRVTHFSSRLIVELSYNSLLTWCLPPDRELFSSRCRNSFYILVPDKVSETSKGLS